MNPNTLRCAAPAAVLGIFLVFLAFLAFFSVFLFFLFFICASVQVICVCWGPPGSWEQPMGHSLIASRHGNDARALLATNKNRQAHAHAHACLSGRVESESRKLKRRKT